MKLPLALLFIPLPAALRVATEFRPRPPRRFLYRFRIFIACAFLALAMISDAADWPHWRGEYRNGISSESTGWDDGTRLPDEALWKSDVGEGASSPLVVDGVLYTLGWESSQDTVYALDAATGAIKWTQSYPALKYGRHAQGDQGYFQGATGTPEFDVETGYLYTLSCDGDLHCWDTKNGGAGVWGFNLNVVYQIPQRPQVTDRRGSRRDYGFTSAPLVHGDQLVVEVGSPEHGNTIAFDKKTGKEVWASENRQPAGHSGGPVPIMIEGVACAAVLNARELLVLRLDNGKTVARFPWVTDFINNIPTPAVTGNRIIVTSRYNQEAMAMIEVSLDEGVREIWKVSESSGVCSPVIHDGHIYWTGGRTNELFCLDLKTGARKWAGGKFGVSSSCVVTGDDRLLIWSGQGSLTLAETAKRSPGKFTELQRKDRIFRGKAWPHVVFSNGRIYCRDIGGEIKCFSLRPEEKSAKPVEVTSAVKPVMELKPDSAPVLRPADLDLSDWPGENDPGLLYAWKRGMGMATPLGSLAKNRVRLQKQEAATFDPAGRMILDQGSYQLLRGTTPIVAAAQETNQLTVETILTTSDLRQSGPARIITFSKGKYHRNFTLGQEASQLVFRLRTPKTGENGSRPETVFGKIEAGKTLHVLVTYRDGELVAYIDGEAVKESDRVAGDFSNWDTGQQLVFGDEPDGSRNWTGAIDGIALLNRFVGPEEVVARYKAAMRSN